MSQLAELIFGNLFLILLIGFAVYLFIQFNYLSRKKEEINKIFTKTLNEYLDKKIKEAEETTDSILKEYGREDEISTEINRLLLTIEKGESGDVNDKVLTSNAINKFRLNENVDLEKYSSLKKLKSLGTFKEEELNNIENGLALARKDYNLLALQYNQKASGFPLQYIVKLFGFKEQYTLFNASKDESYNLDYEVFEEQEEEINLITNLNRREKKETQKIITEAKEEDQTEVTIEHSDIILKPTKSVVDLSEEDMPTLKETKEDANNNSSKDNSQSKRSN